MMKRIITVLCSLSFLLSAGCMSGPDEEDIRNDTATISLTVDTSSQSKSSTIADESLVRDLNVWVFNSSGILAESHYFDGLTINTNGTVSFDSSAGGHSSLVVIGNAGRELQAPGCNLDMVSFQMSYPAGSQGVVLMVGEGLLNMASTGLSSNITLNRAMSRIALRTELASSLRASGGVLGGNVRIREAKFCNSPAVIQILPYSAWNSVREFKANAGTLFQTGDNLSNTDISTLQAGGTVYLYSLPNYTDVEYTDRPGSSTQYASFLEMTVEFDAFGTISAGSTVCRFYANDGSTIGLEGGCSYTCLVVLSNEGANNTWRKDDYRFEIPPSFIAGEEKTVMLHSQIHSVSDVSFSLSETTGVTENGRFRIGEKVYGDYLNGVKVTALSAGTGVLYCFDSEGNMMGSVPLTSTFPSISVSDKELDVLGDEVALDLQGLAEAYSVRASDMLFNNLYSVASIVPRETVSGLNGQDFIMAGISDKRLFVNKLQWERNGAERNWPEVVGKTFPYRVTLACGISADFSVRIVNPVIGPMEGNVYFGEAFDMRLVDDPLPAVISLGAQDGIVAEITAGIPGSFCKPRAERDADGWRTWFGGTRFSGGTVADDYMTGYGINHIVWNFPAEAVRTLYGAEVPVYVGKLNPHCGEYVKARVGYYASTCYNPVGVDLFIEVLEFVGKTTSLCFRPHESSVTLDLTEGNFAYQGRDGGPTYSNESAIGGNGYAFLSDGSYLETNWDGDLTTTEEFSEGGAFFSTSQFIYDVAAPYSTAAYGARGGRHLAIYHYAPYTYSGAHAEIADENGHVTSKGFVSVEKWSVSSKAFFDWDASGFTRPSSSGDP